MVISYKKCIFNRTSKTKLKKRELRQLKKLFQWKAKEILSDYV